MCPPLQLWSQAGTPIVPSPGRTAEAAHPNQVGPFSRSRAGFHGDLHGCERLTKAGTASLAQCPPGLLPGPDRLSPLEEHCSP